MFRAYIFKIMRSPYLYIGFIGVLAISFYSMNRGRNGGDVYTDLFLLLDIESYRRMYAIFGAIPFAANFADEWNSRTISSCVTRKNVLKYSVSNIAVCFISAFAAVFLGLMIFVFADLMLKPPFDELNPTGAYAELFENGAVLLPFLFTTMIFALSCGMWAIMGLTLSAFFPSKYVAVCSPFVFCYLIERLTRSFPEEFDLHALAHSATSHSAAFIVPWASGVFLAVSLICGIIFTLVVRRRVQNGLS